MEKSKTIRTFIACPIPQVQMQKITRIQERLKKYRWKARWTPVANIHLTLSFLGDIHLYQQTKIEKALKPLTLSQNAFKFHLGNLGVFPSPNRPNVMWLGLSGDVQALITFQKKVQSALEPLGFPVDKRPFKAHLTIGRFKGHIPKDQLAEALCMDIISENCQFCCDRMVFYQSILSSKGACYNALAEWKLCCNEL
ncbi:2'-5' RNA ligase [Candidatus Magnetomorum sp. HK-1]|nr:2'-5' RNA ligase [Candidatus Magnetomorum sp. HK-1]